MVELILQTILRISALSFLFSKPHDKMLLGSFRGLWHLPNSGSSRTSAGLDGVGIKSRYCLTTFITTYEQKLDTRIRDRKGEGGRFEGSDVDDVDGGVSSMLCPRSASRRSWMIIAVVAVILLTMSLRHALTHEPLFVLSPCLETHCSSSCGLRKIGKFGESSKKFDQLRAEAWKFRSQLYWFMRRLREFSYLG